MNQKTGENTLSRTVKKTHIASMSSPINPDVIETRRRAIEASYLRQLELAGKPGYDPQLTIELKKDLDWLKEQEHALEENNHS